MDLRDGQGVVRDSLSKEGTSELRFAWQEEGSLRLSPCSLLGGVLLWGLGFGEGGQRSPGWGRVRNSAYIILPLWGRGL